MPIYEYRCSHCGHQQEFLQKVSEAPRTRCTQCGQETLSKMVTAAGFQLKGSGWYATDFKGGASKPAAKETPGSGESKPGAKDTPGGGESKPAAKETSGGGESKSDTPASAAPAGGKGACPACR